MTTPGVWTQYSTVAPFLGALPGWVPSVDKQRIASYLKYDQMYWASEEGFDQVLRGDNENPIFLPTGRTLVNTLDRYTAPALSFRVVGGDTEAALMAQLAFDALFTREMFVPKFNGFKLMGGKLGDALIHVVGDLDKPLGKRLRITVVDPAAYFPVYDEDDPERIVKVHLAEQITIDGNVKVNRLTYEKVTDEATGRTVILRSHGIFATENWWDLTTPERVILAPEPLDPRITQIPVYHYKNGDPTQPFGSSDLRGLEFTLAGINQAISDEDLTLAMEGLGVWATDGEAPVDADGNEVDWIFGPGRVITRANGLRRMDGASSMSPYGEHIDRLERSARESLGASDVAIGRVTGTEAESGIALKIRLGPILAGTGKKDLELDGLLNQFFYDLQFWLEVYEGIPLLTAGPDGPVPVATVLAQFGEKVPVNLTEVITQVVQLRNCVPPVLSLRTSHALLRAAGMAIPDNELEILANEAVGVFDPLEEPTGAEDVADEARVDEELV